MLIFFVPRTPIHWAVALSLTALGVGLGVVANVTQQSSSPNMPIGFGVIGFSLGSSLYALHLQDQARAARGESLDLLREGAVVLALVGVLLLIPNSPLPLGRVLGGATLPLAGLTLVAAAGIGTIWLRRRRARDAIPPPDAWWLSERERSGALQTSDSTRPPTPTSHSDET